jgi:hypothetical protein
LFVFMFIFIFMFVFIFILYSHEINYTTIYRNAQIFAVY